VTPLEAERNVTPLEAGCAAVASWIGILTVGQRRRLSPHYLWRRDDTDRQKDVGVDTLFARRDHEAGFGNR